MVKMASFVKEAPTGFEDAVEFMNGLKDDVLKGICYEVIDLLQYRIGAVKTDHWFQKIQETDRLADQSKVQSAINALVYIFRSSAVSKLTEEQLNDHLGSSSVFSESTQSVITTVWAEQGKSLVESGVANHCLGVGQLIDVQWKVGMAMSSDSCKNLNSPFVCLALTVADTSGNLSTHNLELTMLQFRNFTDQLKEIASVLETV